MPKVGLVSLGCPKNLVDSEVMLGHLVEEGYEITAAPQEADVIIVNTCAFIEDAKEESIETILEMAAYKEHGKCRRLVVTGCLAQRYREQIQRELPEVDAVLGVNEIPAVARACDGDGALTVLEEQPLYLYDEREPRVLTTPPYTAYIKIAEGCDHPCTFCVIPRMRGPFRSRPLDSILAEARTLAKRGVKEVNLVAQDSTMYGQDRGERGGLAELLRRLNEVEGLRWIRFLYAYPTSLTDDTLEAVAATEKVCKYIDMPLQSASRRVLQRMKRGGHREAFLRLLERIRSRVPNVTLRSTLIVGFPGETEEDFQETVKFVEEAWLDRLGVFTYSDEEDAPASRLAGKVPREVASERAAILMEIQKEISRKKNRRLVGSKVPVLLAGPSPETDLLWWGRMEGQAPDIDGVVYINDGIEEGVRPGEIYPVRITEAHDYDLVGAVEP
ncbi:MAG: 30S ribosomal protein S12 methylthiotransferase RimO [Acidobacteriota bacterium]